jgi:hypothetical protein
MAMKLRKHLEKLINQSFETWAAQEDAIQVAFYILRATASMPDDEAQVVIDAVIERSRHHWNIYG